MVCDSKSNTFAKTICSICYEDLKPIVEDLQSISICGHVFHELCIQQWFEYCPNGKKRNCPVCKQTCSGGSVNRLYFQSVGDSASSQKPISIDEDSVELQIEIEKLKGKVQNLSSDLERQQNDAKEFSKELCLSQDLVKKETAMKNEALRQKASIQQMFRSTLEELDKSNVECTRLQERNMALAKELAAIKLASDLNLEEADVLKLASLGNEASSKDKIDVLKKTLVLRNKSYKELLAKCNVMGRGEARCLRKLEKKKEKIKKLKSRIHELEKSSEEKENQVLRALRNASKRASCEEGMQTDARTNFNSSFVNKYSKSRMFKPINLEENESKGNHVFSPSKTKKFKASNDMVTPDPKCDTSPIALSKGVDSNGTIVENEPNTSPVIDRISNTFTRSYIIEDIVEPIKSVPSPKVAPPQQSEDTGYVIIDKSDSVNKVSANSDDDEVLILDDIKQFDSFPLTEKEAPYQAPIAQPGDVCFSGGLLAPDGTLRHLGKWCKRTQSTSAQGSSSDDLIAVGADGRGGKIKVLRSLNQLSESKEATALTKKCKLGAKTSSLQARGSLQIEHFFRKAGR